MWLAADVTVMVGKVCELAKQPQKWKEVFYHRERYSRRAFATNAGTPNADKNGHRIQMHDLLDNLGSQIGVASRIVGTERPGSQP
jgi:hypothetical protein